MRQAGFEPAPSAAAAAAGPGVGAAVCYLSLCRPPKQRNEGQQHPAAARAAGAGCHWCRGCHWCQGCRQCQGAGARAGPVPCPSGACAAPPGFMFISWVLVSLCRAAGNGLQGAGPRTEVSDCRRGHGAEELEPLVSSAHWLLVVKEELRKVVFLRKTALLPVSATGRRVGGKMLQSDPKDVTRGERPTCPRANAALVP